ncbi:hypothetical protein OC844_007147 [Tilletia horrida]|nr:hypothetical protein OC844_007147 [Tilletia horrida]
MGKQRTTSPLVAAAAARNKQGKGRASTSATDASAAASASASASSASARASAATSAAALKDLDVSAHAGNINLGNTCFLNSVLQAAAATVPLQELIEHQWAAASRSADPAAAAAAAGASSEWTDHDSDHDDAENASGTDALLHRANERRRRRAAAKGKAKAREHDLLMPQIPLGTREAPLSDALRTHLSRAWSHRPPMAGSSSSSSSSSTSINTRKKSAASAHSLNPRPLLNALARKYDQYGDFAQQDAHELLRHLLDACRMEEVDLIKKLKAEQREEEEAEEGGEGEGEGEGEEGMEQAEELIPEASPTTANGLAPTGSQESTIDAGPSRPPAASRRPVLVRPSPIPAHLRPDPYAPDGSSDTDDSDTAVLLNPPLASSGELTPVPNSRTNATSAGPHFFPPPAALPSRAPGAVLPNGTHKPGPKQAKAITKKPEYRPLIDVVFGGQLASIIVCESCRNIRHTYEDFYDISLSLRDESGTKVSDKSRKRDRIRSMAELWRRAGGASGSGSSANDARALIAKAQLAHDEAGGRAVMSKRRGSVAAMSETEVSETEAVPGGLMERRRQKTEQARRRASISFQDKLAGTGAESSAGEEKGRANGSAAAAGGGGKSIFRTGSIRRSLGHISKSSKESIVSDAPPAAATPGSPYTTTTGNHDVVEGLERAVASMSMNNPALSPSAHSTQLPTPDAGAAEATNVPRSPPQAASTSVSASASQAIFSFWRSSRSSSKSPAPSLASTSAGFSLIDSPDFRSRSASPHRAAAAAAAAFVRGAGPGGDGLRRPASAAVPDLAHLAPPPANAHAHAIVPAHLQEAYPHHDGASTGAGATLHHVPSAPAGLGMSSDSSSQSQQPQPQPQPQPASQTSLVSASPIASLLSRTKAPPSSSFTPPSSNQTSPAVLATRFASGTKLHLSPKAGASRFGGGGGGGGAAGLRRGPSRQAVYLTKILADVVPSDQAAASGAAAAVIANGHAISAAGEPLSAVEESPVDGSAAHDRQYQPPERSASAAAALLHKVNGSSPPASTAATLDAQDSAAKRGLPPTGEVIAAEFETGLGRALCQFTKVELLEGENAFKCRRCWRIANPRSAQERQRRRDRERLRKLRLANKAAGTDDAEGNEENEDEDEDERNSSETPSSDLDSSEDEDVDGALQLPPSLNRPALTRSNLQMNASKLAAQQQQRQEQEQHSPESSRRSSVDSDALDVMGASILSAPGKLGESQQQQQQRRLSAAGLAPLSAIPSIRMTVPSGSYEGQRVVDPDVDAQGQEMDRTATSLSQQSSSIGPASSVEPPATASRNTSAGGGAGGGSTDQPGSGNGSSLGNNESSTRSSSSSNVNSAQHSLTASSASVSPRESVESSRLPEPTRSVGEDADREEGEEPTARPGKASFGPQVKGERDSMAAKKAAASASPSSGDHNSKPPPAGAGPRMKAMAERPKAKSGKKKAAEAIERRALKRYLIASAPPVLVFHFKRFQSNGSSNSSSNRFSARRSRASDFSKIDDPVTFPEYFDVSPWLAPPREEFNRRGVLKGTSDAGVLAQVGAEERARISALQHQSHFHTQAPFDAPPPHYHHHHHHHQLPHPTAPKPPRSPFRFLQQQHKVDSPSTPRQEWFSASVGGGDGDGGTAKMVADAGQSLEAAAGIAKKKPGTLYGLYAVINHQGTMTGGHYTAYVLTDRVRSKSAATAAAKDGLGEAKAKASKSRSSSRTHSRQVSSSTGLGVGSPLAKGDGGATGDEEGMRGRGSANAEMKTEAETGAGAGADADADGAEADGRKRSGPAVGVAAAAEEAVAVVPAAAADERQWVHVSDATVRAATAAEVFASKYVYMLFYERL